MSASPMSLLKTSMSALHMDATGGSAYPHTHAHTHSHGMLDSGAGAALAAASTAPMDVSMAQQLQDLAKQLSLQMDYNNELLSQLQRVEESHLLYQKGAQEKQAALRQALAVADAARAEANDLKRKLAIAQEVSAKVSDELKEARVDNGILKRQLEALEKLALEAKAEIGALRDERQALAAAAEAASEDARSLRRDLAATQADAEDEIAKLNGQNGNLARELSDLRARQGPLLAEVDASRSNLMKLHEECEDAKRARADALAKLDRAQGMIQAQDSALRDMKAAEARLLRSLEEEQARVAALQAAAARDAEIMALKDGELLAAQQKATDAMADAAQARDEVAAARRELETLSAELVAQARARSADAEHYEARLRDAGDDIRRIADEARAREAAHAAEISRVTNDLIAARAAAEEQQAALQSDIASLHDMVSGLRNDKAGQARAFDEERVAYERRVGELQHRLAVTTEAAERNDAELRAANAALSSQVGSLRDEMSARNERHLAMLSALQGALRQLRSEAESVRGDYGTLTAATRSLHGHIGEALASVQVPLQQWYEEVQRAFLYLMDVAESAKKAAGDSEDAAQATELALEEARARGLMLEEALSRTEHEAANKGQRLAETQALLEARDAAAAEAARAAAALTDDLRAEIARLRAALDKANKTNMTLQSDNARATSELAEAQSKHAARVSGLEEQVGALQSSVRSLTAQNETLNEERARATAQVEAQAAVIEQLRRENRFLASQADTAVDSNRQAVAAYAAQIASLSEGMKKMEGQLKQTQNLLAVVQEQRRTLQENNVALRAELDDRYKASLLAAANAVGAPPTSIQPPSMSAMPAYPSATPTPGGPTGFAPLTAPSPFPRAPSFTSGAPADAQPSLDRVRSRASMGSAVAPPPASPPSPRASSFPTIQAPPPARTSAASPSAAAQAGSPSPPPQAGLQQHQAEEQ